MAYRRTLKRAVGCTGIGLHSGKPVRLVLRPAPPEHGLRFRRTDVGVEIPVFDDLTVRVIIWKGDDEFGPEATMLYDKNISTIFPTEDVAVLSRFVAHGL